MIKEIFKDSEFSFRKWNQLFLYDSFFKEIFKNDYVNASNERKKDMLLKHAFNERIPC
jgi:hypothetical protein